MITTDIIAEIRRMESERRLTDTLADEIARIVHAFSDPERRARVRELAQRVRDLEVALAVAQDAAGYWKQCTREAEAALERAQCAVRPDHNERTEDT